MRLSRRVLRSLFLALFALHLALGSFAESPKRSALVIGNSAYPEASTLASPAYDAREISTALSSLGFAVQTLLDADLSSIVNAATLFVRDSIDSDIRLVYFSGYAVQYGGGNWLVPAGSAVKPTWSAKTEAFSADSLFSNMNASKKGLSIFIIDSSGGGPFSDRAERAGLAAMSADNSIVVFSTAKQAALSRTSPNEANSFAKAIAKEVQKPGKSVQEALLAALERSSVDGRQPWSSMTTPELVYFTSPESALQAVLEAKTKAESMVKQLDGKVGELKARIGAEKDQTQKKALEAELKAQSDLLAQKKREYEEYGTEHQRLVSAAEERKKEESGLTALAKEQAERLESVQKLAELRQWEISSLIGGAQTIDAFLKAIETTTASRTDIRQRFRASLETYKTAIGNLYEKGIRAAASWSKYPWESDEAFRQRSTDERIRLTCERLTRVAAVDKGADLREHELLAAFDALSEKAFDGLENARMSYRGDSVNVRVGAYDVASSSYPITVTSTESALPFTATLVFSIAGGGAEEQRSRYLEFESLKQAKALFAEIDTSVSRIPGLGYATIVEEVRVKAKTADGDRLVVSETRPKPVARFKGSSDRERPTPVSSWISVVGVGTEISVDGGERKKHRLFIPDPKSGSHVVRAVLDDGSLIERRVDLEAGGSVLVEFRFGRFTLPWLASGSTVSLRGAAADTERETQSLFASSTEFVREYKHNNDGPFRSPLIPEGSYRISIQGDFAYSTQLELRAYTEIELPGYKNSLLKSMNERKAGLERSIGGKATRKKIGIAALGVGVLGAAGAVASYYLGAAAAEDIRTAVDTPSAEEAHKRYDFYSVLFPISLGLGGLGLGTAPFLLWLGPDEDKVKKSIESLDAQIKALAK